MSIKKDAVNLPTQLNEEEMYSFVHEMISVEQSKFDFQNVFPTFTYSTQCV